MLSVKKRVRQEGYTLTLADRILLRTHRSDMLKLPLFVAILVILEEALPLVVIYMPALLPSTCILPSQLEAIYAGKEIAKDDAVRELGAWLQDGSEPLPAPWVAEEGRAQGAAKAAETVAREVHALVSDARAQGHLSPQASALASLSRSTLERLCIVYALPSGWWRPTAMLRSRLAAHLRVLVEDDRLMHKAEGENRVPTDQLSVVRACSERGLRAVGVPLEEQIQCESKEAFVPDGQV